jgi:hypothetical protein
MSATHSLKEEDLASSNLATDGGRSVEQMVDRIDGVDPEAGMPGEVAMAVAELLRKLVRPRDAHSSAVRFIALVHHLSPDIINQSLTKSARQLEITRAGLSKTGINILEEFRIPSRYHKSSQARESYRRAQIRLVKLGRHASNIRLKKKLKTVLTVDKNGKGYGTKTRGSQHHFPRQPAKTACKPCNPS